MAKVFFNSEVKIPYADMCDLKTKGILQIGIDKTTALRLSGSKQIPAPLKFVFPAWPWLALALFAGSVVLSFIYDWWLFMGGLLLAAVIWRTDKKKKMQNLLEAGLSDQACYLALMDADVWMYNIKDEHVDSIYRMYKVNRNEDVPG
jgi:hypothetical protein